MLEGMAWYGLRVPLTVLTTATGQSIQCQECDFTEPIARGTSVRGFQEILRDHYEMAHLTPDALQDDYYGPNMLQGDGPPSARLGSVGDYYLDRVSGDFYGPKTGTGWTLSASLEDSIDIDGGTPEVPGSGALDGGSP